MPVLPCIVGGVFITCAVCGHIEPTQIFAESSQSVVFLLEKGESLGTRLVYSRHEMNFATATHPLVCI